MPLIAVLSLVLLFLGHSTLAGITGLIFALLFLPIRIGIASSIAMLVTKLVMLTLIPLSMAYNGIFNKIREFMLPDNHSFL